MRSGRLLHHLTTGAQRLADVGISLLIQANTSIGTTPVLLARDKDLPRAQKEAGAFSADTALHQEIRLKLEAPVALTAASQPKQVETAYRELGRRLDEAVLGRGALRVLGAPLRRVLDSRRTSRQRVRSAGIQTEPRRRPYQLAGSVRPRRGIPRRAGPRRQASDLFLQWVASGQISAFALTEPSAGSDTARVATRAVLRSVPVVPGADAYLRFTPFAGREPRTCLTPNASSFARRKRTASGSIAPITAGPTRLSPAPICFDEYDYETDDPHRTRYLRSRRSARSISPMSARSASATAGPRTTTGN